MQLNELLNRLSAISIEHLPGSRAHEKMRAIPTGNRKMNFKFPDEPRKGSVLILFYESDGKVKFPLIKRPQYEGAHGGQISLPGGKMEPGENQIMTALREAHEEVGIDINDVKVVGSLSDFHVIPSNFMITPVIGTIAGVPSFVPDPFEVERILTGDLNDLLWEDAVKMGDIVVGPDFSLTAPYFEVEGEMVWGATAMMLSELREILIG